MSRPPFTAAILAATALAGGTTSHPEEMGNLHHELDMASYYLPDAGASRLVSVATSGVAAANLPVPTGTLAGVAKK